MSTAVIMMFRDEADILDQCLQHWQSLGIDKFYLCDNGSIDSSYLIAKKYDPDTIKDMRTNWPGREVLNKLKNKALEDGHTWIFPIDADEFLTLPHKHTLHEWLAKYDDTPQYCWGEIKYLNIRPNGKLDWQEPHRKVFGKLHPDWMISMGNHVIEHNVATLDPYGAYYRHYSLRSYPQFRQKMINYMTAFGNSQFKDHPHAKSFLEWQVKGEDYLISVWNTLLNM